MKKVLMIVIDACTSRVLVPAMDNGKLPNFTALAEAGYFNPTCVSIFPSITHAATASLATGYYPQVHGIAGSHWYNTDNDDPVYYSGDFWVILKRGVDQFFEDFVIKLNHQWLQAKTIFQTVERAGLKASCVNHIIFRGDVPHTLNIPQLLSLLPGIPTAEKILGPSLIYLGDFIQVVPPTMDELKIGEAGLLQRFGLEDAYTANVLVQMAQARALPDFTLAYFPDNDDQSHKVGPEPAIYMLEHIDTRLGELFETYGGLTTMLQDVCLIITGDHAQSKVLADEAGADICLNDTLSEFSLAEAGQPWSGEDDLVVCPNLRMAQIYFRHPTPSQFEQVMQQLLKDERIDQVMWRADITDAAPGYRVVSANRGQLHFWQEDNDNTDVAIDEQGNAWRWQGDLSVVNGLVTADNRLSFPDYPNAFERIKGGLECKSGGHLWVTAQPGYEFSLTNMSIHADGGSHGSLHVLDSIVPLLVAGTPDEIALPTHPRIVDIAPLCLSILGIKN